MTGGPVQGLEVGERWAAVGLQRGAALVAALAPLIERRQGKVALLADSRGVLEYWQQERHGLRAVCLVGTEISWRVQERLQLDGALVGRLPFADPEPLAEYAKRLVARERSRVERKRVGWIVCAEPDPFTAALEQRLGDALERGMRRRGFLVRRFRGDRIDEHIDDAGVIILLTHGSDPPAAGEPVGLSEEVRARIMDACRGGAVVMHLGCSGAGMLAGGRFEELPRRLGLEGCPIADADVFSEFGCRCLAAGAGAVVAHVDSTWSIAFQHPRPIVDWIDWICSGRGAVAHAADSISAEANRAGADAFERRRMGDELGSGMAWLRHLDLKGFVVLGDPSSHFRWSRR
ncbi:MAG: hypothetical protein IT372_05865 [Polyangiaceae bacterium]|nr:hypothetical protein [Polyangiaceae bacterium]